MAREWDVREVYGEDQLHRHIDVSCISAGTVVVLQYAQGDCLKWSRRKVGVELPDVLQPVSKGEDVRSSRRQ